MKSSTTVRIGKAQKLRTLGAGMAIRLAKENNDPLYSRYKKMRLLYKLLKQQLIRKYKAKGMLAAKQAVIMATKAKATKKPSGKK
jgi:hypothetical protein